MTNQIEKIIKEFDERFNEKIKNINYYLSEGDTMLDIKEIKDFFRSSLKETCEDMMRETEIKKIDDDFAQDLLKVQGYNQALAEIKQKQQEWIDNNLK